jgi:hypothetical protein
MTLVDPDILTEARDLSLVVLGATYLVGILLWLLGGWGHRFCIVLLTTLFGGIGGLYLGPPFGMQPLVAGLMLAVAAGALALSLVRVGVFLLSGLTLFWIAWKMAPGWEEPLACFLAGGLLGIILFRVWIMGLASLAGTLLMTYALLCLIGRLGKADVVTWTTNNGPLLNWSIAAVTVLGIMMQALIQRRRANAGGGGGKPAEAPKPAKPAAPPPPPAKTPWWKFGVKKAG